MDADLRRKERDRTLGVADLARTGDLLAMAELAEGEGRRALCLEWLAANDAVLPEVYTPAQSLEYFDLTRVVLLNGVFHGCPLFECESRNGGWVWDSVRDSAVRMRPDGDGVVLSQAYKNGIIWPTGPELFRGALLGACQWLRENRVNKVGSPCQ